MKVLKFTAILLICSFMLSFFINIKGIEVFTASNTYYISTSGSDTNSGMAANQAFKTIAKVNSLNLTPGDQVLFNCGDIWEGEELTIKNSGTQLNPIKIGSNPANCTNKPVISGSKDVSGFASSGANLYVADLNSGANGGKFTNGINQVFGSGNRLQLGRYPNIDAPEGGYMNITGQPNATTLNFASLPQSFSGGNVHVRGMTWYIENHKILSQSGNQLTTQTNVTCWGGDCSLKGGSGAWIDNNLNTLDQNGEWYYDEPSNKLYIYSTTGSPTNIQASVVNRTDNRSFGGINLGLDMSAPISNVIVDNFEVRNSYRHGIAAPTNFEGSSSQQSSNIVISNNKILNSALIGLNLFTWTFNSVADGWYGGTDLTVLGNTIDGANMNAIFMASNNSNFSNNKIQNIALLKNFSPVGMGCGLYGGDCTENGNAVVISKQLDNGKNNQFTLNQFNNLGTTAVLDYGGSNAFSKNYINTIGLTKAEAVGFRMYGTGSTNTTLSQNIVINGIGNLDGTNNDWDTFRIDRGGWAWGIHSDAGATNTTVSKNTIIHMAANGLIFDTPGGTGTVTENKIYGAGRANLGMGGGFNINHTNNTYVNNIQAANVYEVENAGNFGQSSGNYLSNPYSPNFIQNNTGDQTLTAWQTTGKDTDATTNSYTQTPGQNPRAVIYYNPTDVTVTKSIGSGYKTLAGTAISSLTIPAFESQIIVADLIPLTSTPNGIDITTVAQGGGVSVNATSLSAQVFLSGPYNPISSGMNLNLNAGNLIPLSEPYSTTPTNYPGTESVASINPNIVDWVLVQIRSGAGGTTIAQKAGLLTDTGNIVDASDQTSPLNLGNLPSGSYNVTIRHRNHLAISTNTPITITSNTVTNLDFTGNANVYGSNQFLVKPGVYGMKSSNANGDGIINATDRVLTRRAIDAINVYSRMDLNMNGSISSSDRSLARASGDSIELIR